MFLVKQRHLDGLAHLCLLAVHSPGLFALWLLFGNKFKVVGAFICDAYKHMEANGHICDAHVTLEQSPF